MKIAKLQFEELEHDSNKPSGDFIGRSSNYFSFPKFMEHIMAKVQLFTASLKNPFENIEQNLNDHEGSNFSMYRQKSAREQTPWSSYYHP